MNKHLTSYLEGPLLDNEVLCGGVDGDTYEVPCETFSEAYKLIAALKLGLIVRRKVYPYGPKENFKGLL